MQILKKVSWKTMVLNLYVFSILALIVIIFSSVSLKFIGVPNITNILRQSVPALLIGCSITLLMFTNHIDLSVGGIVGLSSVVFALLLKSGCGFFWAAVLALTVGVLVGYINGFLVMKLRIVPVIATLATMNLTIGLGKLLSPPGVGMIKGLPSDTVGFARTPFLLKLPMSVYVAVLVIAILIILHKRTALGKYALSIGGNKTAAELSGINTVKTVWVLYIIAGVCAALAGITRTSLLSLGDPTTGMGMETDAMIAVVLGGTSFTGGEGSVFRTIIGVLILMVMTAGMQVIGIESFWQNLVKGIVMVVALAINSLVKEKIVE